MATQTPNDYLQAVLDQKTISSSDKTNDYIKELVDEREKVKTILETKYPGASLALHFAGSYAKNTMTLPPSDLDLAAYVQRDETAVGDTLEEIYQNLHDTLSETYNVEKHRSCVRLLSRKDGVQMVAAIDVVPGRYINEDSKKDSQCFIYQTEGEKCRLKTDLRAQVRHVRDSGFTNIIKLAKVWKKQNNISVRTFVLELLIIKILSNAKDVKSSDYAACLRTVWNAFKDDIENISIEDPGNANNDLSGIFDASTKASLKSHASTALTCADIDMWSSILGTVEVKDKSEKRAILESIRVSTPQVAQSRPWARI